MIDQQALYLLNHLSRPQNADLSSSAERGRCRKPSSFALAVQLLDCVCVCGEKRVYMCGGGERPDMAMCTVCIEGKKGEKCQGNRNRGKNSRMSVSQRNLKKNTED